MIEDCFNLIDNNGKCVITGKVKGREICYTGSYPMDILGSLHWDDLISRKYFEFIKEKAIAHIKRPTAYEKTMWIVARGNKQIIEDEETIFMFSCWIEDKFNAKEVAKIIKKYALLDEFELKFNCDEVNKNKYNTIIEECKLCLTN